MSVDVDALASWYAAVRRELPWRADPAPYPVWLSEVMSQQTTIKALIPYYERFLARFPAVEDLAAASIDEVLELWSGLGYYRRARNLHAAAQRLAAEGFPTTAAGWRELPGVGPYTAAAIASVVYGEAVAVVDGNVERVVSRLYAIREVASRGAGKAAIARRAQALVERAEVPGEHNQAMMELGSLVCRPGAGAACLLCPLRAGCAALEQGLVAELPTKAARPKVTERRDRCLAIARDGRWLLGKLRAGEVWGGLWELPRATVAGPESLAESATRIGRERLGRRARLLSEAPVATIKHGVMNERITLEVLRARVHGGVRAAGYEELRWWTLAEAREAALPSPQRRAIAALADQE